MNQKIRKALVLLLMILIISANLSALAISSPIRDANKDKKDETKKEETRKETNTTKILGIEFPITPWLGIPIFLVVLAAVGILIDSVVLNILSNIAKRTVSAIDDLVIRYIRKFMPLWLAIIAIAVIVSSLTLTPEIHSIVSQVLRILLILAVLWPVMLMLLSLVDVWIANQESVRPAASIIKTVTKIAFVVIGALMVMSALRIEISPLLATLGVSSLAVGLALQDTLSNFFAGLHVMADRPIRIGDYIKLGSNEEGYVDTIGWRSTRLRTEDNNLIIIPNQKITQSTVINFSMPEKITAVKISFGVSYNEDPARIESMVENVVKTCQHEIEGLLLTPEPSVEFISMGESSINFSLTCYIQEFKHRRKIQNLLTRKIFEKFREEKIEIPFPTRTIHIKDNKS